MKKVVKATPKKPTSRVRIQAPPSVCIYHKNEYKYTASFFDQIDVEVFGRFNYVELDFSETSFISAAAALMVFAKVTRCQCWASHKTFSSPEQIITTILPKDKATRDIIVKNGLWAAIKPGGQRKLDELWKDVRNPYKTGSDPANEITDIIKILQVQCNPLPRHIVSAMQEAYLNIAHHAYEKFKNVENPLHEFMIGRWWQYASKNEKEKKITIIIYDTGSGIHDTIGAENFFSRRNSDEVERAMSPGVTRLSIQGRGMGFENIKKPVKLNEFPAYLVVYSGKGQVVYKRGEIIDKSEHSYKIGGTLIEWVFGELEDER
ncbi:hypothetical protein [Halopseudomonas pelagia]|uniref:hypothetical protein n=1 Tax=Halopseudomonas pelagia TaxID=553151 RepID=UPI0003A74647|nr:hypothetical protein [Halopseudomonas pelagia]